MVNYHDLDTKSQRILEAVQEYGGEISVSDVKDYTGLKAGQIHYRVDGERGSVETLKDRGLLTVRKVDASKDRQGRKILSLTDQGADALDQFREEEGPTIAEQVRQMDARISDMEETVEEVHGRLDWVEETTTMESERTEEKLREFDEKLERFEELSESMEDMIEEIEEFEERLSEVEDQPFEDVIDQKIGKLEEVAQKIQRRDAVNADVRRVLEQAGIIERTRKELHPHEAPDMDDAYIKKQRDNPTRNTLRRDAYEAGPAVED